MFKRGRELILIICLKNTKAIVPNVFFTSAVSLLTLFKPHPPIQNIFRFFVRDFAREIYISFIQDEQYFHWSKRMNLSLDILLCCR